MIGKRKLPASVPTPVAPPSYLPLVRRLLAESTHDSAQPAAAGGRVARAVGITSCALGGLQRVATELAIAAAHLRDFKVLLVETNRAAPDAAQRFEIPRTPGWTEYMASESELADAIYPSMHENLWILPAGERDSTAVAWHEEIGREAIQQLKGQYDLILFNLPAATQFSECFSLAPLLDGVLLVVEAQRTERELAHRVKRDLVAAHVNVLGVVLHGQGRATVAHPATAGPAAPRRFSLFAFRRGRRNAGNNPTTGLMSQLEFRRIVEAERLRSDRSENPLSLLVFSPEGASSPAEFAELAHTIRQRVRMTDTCGFWDGRRVGVLLPDTAEPGAWKLASDLRLLLQERSELWHCDVYSYPLISADATGAGPHGAPAELASPSPETEALPRRELELPGVDAPASHPSRAAASSPTTDSPRRERRMPAGAARQHQTGPGSVLPLEPLLVHALPRWKRLVDVLGAGAGLVLLSPLLLAIAVIMKFASPGPLFFTQLRSGLGGRPFRMIKFRTMSVNAEAAKAALRSISEQDGPAFKLRNDPRVTRFGKYLRQTSLDELPQLWNVLRGDMTLVGPRPLPIDESNSCNRWQRRRISVTPGLTCLWQVSGRSQVSFDEWVRMDLQYVRRRSPRTDITLILKTIPAVIFRRGAH